MKRPYNAIDYQRAVLICLVIVVHTVHFTTLHPSLKAFINSFFMQAFLLVTAYLVKVERTPLEFARYLGKIALPYAIMVSGYAYVSTLTPVSDGIRELTPATLAHVVFVAPLGPYWFLHTMIVCGALYYVSFRLLRRFGTAAQFSVFATLLLLVAELTPLLSATHAAFYALGVAVRLTGKRIDELLAPSLWPVIPFCALACLNRGGQVSSFLAACVLAFSFLSFTPRAITSLHSARLLRWAGFVGRNTLPVYLFHPIFTMAAKRAAPLFAFDPTGLAHITVTVAAGVLGSYAIAWALDRTRLSLVFGRQRFMR